MVSKASDVTAPPKVEVPPAHPGAAKADAGKVDLAKAADSAGVPAADTAAF